MIMAQRPKQSPIAINRPTDCTRLPSTLCTIIYFVVHSAKSTTHTMHHTAHQVTRPLGGSLGHSVSGVSRFTCWVLMTITWYMLTLRAVLQPRSELGSNRSSADGHACAADMVLGLEGYDFFSRPPEVPCLSDFLHSNHILILVL